jgi:hypothetical protein
MPRALVVVSACMVLAVPFFSDSLPPCGGGSGWGVASVVDCSSSSLISDQNCASRFAALPPPTLTLPHKGGGNQKVVALIAQWSLLPAFSPATAAPYAPADAVLSLGDTIIKSLAILGGALLGGLAVGLLVQLLVKLAVHKPTPRGVLIFFRILGAIAAGLAVYVFVFGTGGGGFGWGSGWGGTGTGTGAQGLVGDTRPNLSPERPSSAPPSTPVERGNSLTVEMLGGKRYTGGNRFYLAEGTNEPKTLEELRKIIELRTQGTPPIQVIEIVLREDDSVSERDPAVTKLRQLAEDLGLSVKVATPAGGK